MPIPETDPRVLKRPSRTHKFRYRAPAQGGCCGSVYVTVDETDDGNPFRVLLHRGHGGVCQQVLLEAVGRLATLLLQETDMPPERVWRTLIGLNCGEGMIGNLSCLDALAQVLKGQVKEPTHEDHVRPAS